MISAKSYFGCVGLIMLLTFVCGFLFVFAYVTLVGMIASGFSVSPIPVWAREDILEWMYDVPQQTNPYVTKDGFLVFKGPKVPPNYAGSDQLGGHTTEYSQPIAASGSPSEYENGDDGENRDNGGGGGGGRSNAVMGSGNGGGSNGVIGERGSGAVVGGGGSKLNKYMPNYDAQALIDSIQFNQEGYPPPTMLDVNGLEEHRGRTRISGLDFYWWYSYLYNNKQGWWWKVFGNDKDGFTIYDAMAVIMYYESQLEWSNPYLPEAAVRKAHSYCSAMYGHPCQTQEEFVNWFAAYCQSAGNHVLDPHYPTEDYSQIMTDKDYAGLRALAEAFKNSPTEWIDGCTGSDEAMSRPCGWANISYWQGISRNKIASNPDYVFTMEGWGDPWVIPSGCVWAFWGGGVTLNTSTSCPKVR
jgi:hypothetical protein